jgi:hypothetical protein
MKAVREVECERSYDHDDQEKELKVHGSNCGRYLGPV